ncbi:MAG TPA: TIM barrel protein [Pirellulales bacterium]|jgi:putative heme-binding domain-containing protein|nr:TIM barrel protein [Pirellulales bacterium]
MMCRIRACLALLGCLAAVGSSPLTAAGAKSDAAALFARENLIAWCIVPFDAKRRSPEERAAMLERLGLRHFAYDYRKEHVPSFEAEIEACRRHGVTIDAWWFPSQLNDEARLILAVCKKHGIAPQLWVSGGGAMTKSANEQRQRIEQEVARIRPIAEAAAAQGMKVGLYNHGGWFGEPENQLAVIDALGMPNVGIVYNLHHGHAHVDRLPELLAKMRPHLLAINLNGTARDGDKGGRKVLPLGQGELDLQVLRAIVDSGYRGPIGILGHTQDDAEARLLDNLDGLLWLVPQVDGKAVGPKPTPRTTVPPPAKNEAAVKPSLPKGSAPMPAAGVHLKPVDPRLKVTLIDRSTSDVYMGVKVDAVGQVFVGGREAVFVFEPQSDGSFGPRRELLRFPPDSIIMGLEFRGDDLYVLTINALYRVPGGRTQQHRGLRPERILWGLPLDLHVSFHCLAWGPDGDLYLTHGDPLLQYGDWTRPDHWGHWTLYCGRDEIPVPYTGQGAVLAVKPDGTGLRVIARGLRGAVGLAFDDRGNLFTNDNDHESRADQYAPARLLHVLPGIDFGWPRGWMASKSPDRYDLIEPMCADLGRGVPCALAYFGNRGESNPLTQRLLMCRWDRHAVTAYRPLRRGISFTAQEELVLEGDENARPVGIDVDRHGRLFVTALYMTGNMAAPECPSDLVMVSGEDTSAAARSPATVAPPRDDRSLQNLLVDAKSDDTYRRQLAVTHLAEHAALDDLLGLCRSSSQRDRLAGVLAIGHRLTVPGPHSIPPEKLALFYPKENAFFKPLQRFYGSDEPVDLAAEARIGAYTIAEWWRTIEHSSEHERLFACLVAALGDSSVAVQLQAAYFLSLLNDPRSEPLVVQTRRGIQLKHLAAAPAYPVKRVWRIGPFIDADAAAWDRPHGPEQGSLDLSATWNGKTWQQRPLGELGATDRSSVYTHFQVHSGRRQPGLLTLRDPGSARLWQNGNLAADPGTEEKQNGRTWIVDLQPGSNDFLLRMATGVTTVAEPSAALVLRAANSVEIVLPEKLDSAQLAARLREAATSGAAQAIAPEFLAVDWASAAAKGDAALGRRLFGTLGCVKCHAIVPDQKSAGAPSLVEARRRFTVPHLVESILLPSRQVAEPFRAQSFVLDDGRSMTGLVTSESADALELLLPDATQRTIAKKSIDERAATQLSPMPQGLVKTPDELRNLLAYLLSERPLPP